MLDFWRRNWTYDAVRSVARKERLWLGAATSFRRLSVPDAFSMLCWFRVFAAFLLHVRGWDGMSMFACEFGKFITAAPGRQAIIRKRKPAQRRNCMSFSLYIARAPSVFVEFCSQKKKFTIPPLKLKLRQKRKMRKRND